MAFVNEIKNKTLQQTWTEKWDFVKSQVFPHSKDSIYVKDWVRFMLKTGLDFGWVNTVLAMMG